MPLALLTKVKRAWQSCSGLRDNQLALGQTKSQAYTRYFTDCLFINPYQRETMSTFDHNGLIQNINGSLAPFRKSQAEPMAAFGQLARSAMAEGAVSEKHKELIALAIGITQHCSGCIGFHVKALVRLGATRQELEEMLAVCVYMGGGPALMYAAETLKAWEEMSAPA